MSDDAQAQKNLQALHDKSFDIKFELNDTDYKPIENIGIGAYGVVCSAVHHLSKKKVAIKKIPDIFEQPTIAKRTYREIKILKHLKHDNIIAIREILKPKGSIENLKDVYIVLDLMETDLHRIIHSKQDLTEEHVRYFLYQLLRGLKYIHSANIIHRDLKPSNLLVNENCDLKIGDFGMARAVASNAIEYNHLMTQYVATRWYRAPELMMAKVAYSGAVDMWSVGCIFAEMLGRQQIFPGKNYIHQMKLIIGVLGTPSNSFLKLMESGTIRNFMKGFGNRQPISLKQLYPKASPKALDLLKKLLVMNPQERVGVTHALSDPFLSKYHDPVDEPVCVPAFHFDFEQQESSPSEIKRAILHEIMEYHKVKEKPKITFDFRPVPKEQILKKEAKKAASTAAPTESNNFGLNEFLEQLRFQHKSNEKRKLNEKSVDSEKQSGTNSIPAFFSKVSPTKPDPGFKIPVGLPLSKHRNDKAAAEAGDSSDIDMLSAKSDRGADKQDLSVTLGLSSGKDVEMLSANKITGVTQPEQRSVNAKEVLKAAILSAALKKQKGEYVSKPKPMTAQQKQRIRQDKKRKKLEKAMERKKKQKQKEKESSGIKLTEEDKTLLERWKNLQGRNKASEQQEIKPPATATDDTLSLADQQPASVHDTSKDIELEFPGTPWPTVLPSEPVTSQPLTFNNLPATISTVQEGIDLPHTQPEATSLFSPGLDSILNVLAENSNSPKNPPPYTEAISSTLPASFTPQPQATLPFINQSPASLSTSQVNKDSNPPSSAFLPFQSYNSTYSSSTCPAAATSSKQENPGEAQLLTVITRQMMRSHVDDLTLTKTPKGTGGGYGVGLDLECEMIPADRSAPLSATESLIGDWMEVNKMGGLDDHDYEALERELARDNEALESVLATPLNLDNIVNSPT